MLKGGPRRVLGIAAQSAGAPLRAAEIVTDGHAILELGEAAEVEPGARDIVEQIVALAEEFPRAEVIGLDLGPAEVALDGTDLAERLGRPVVWDLAGADLRMGGLGGPMAAFYHFALAKRLGGAEPVALVDLRDACILSWVDPRLPHPESEGALLSFEAGPGRGLCEPPFASGERQEAAVAEDLLERFLGGRHFHRLPPKLFSEEGTRWLLAECSRLPRVESHATLCACAAAAVLAGLDLCPEQPGVVLLAGGDEASLFAQMLAAGADCPVRWLPETGPAPAAQAAAYLAARTLAGLPTSAPSTTGVAAAVGGGEIARPRTSRHLAGG